MTLLYSKAESVSLKSNSEYSEKWVQSIIADDPAIIGLGELILIDQERPQPSAGRLDLLLQDPETKKRFELELQLGKVDEAHIIRSIEYWDIERKRYPQYDHCAVIIAEDITSRFLNVISLFNGSIPLIAIQMQAVKVGNSLTLVFTKVLDELTRGLVDADEAAEATPTDRTYWESRSTKDNVALSDKLLEIAKRIDETLELTFNKFYIGMSRNNQPYNFVIFRPKKNHFRAEFRIQENEDLTEKIESAGIDTLDYDSRYSSYRLRFTSKQISQQSELIFELMKQAYDQRST